MPLRGHVIWTAPIGGPFHTYFHFFGDSNTDASNAAAAVANLLEDLAPSISSSVSAQLQDDWIVFDETDGTQTGVHTISGGSPEPGTDSSTLAPVATQGLVRLRTNTFAGGREVRGRVFIPGVTEASTDGGRPTSAYRNAVDAAFASLRLDPGCQYAVWSKTHGLLIEVGSETVWSEWAVLRSRRD